VREIEVGPKAIAEAILRELEALPKRKTAPMRRVRKVHSRRLLDQPADTIMGVAAAILAPGNYRWIAYELIAEHPQTYTCLDRRKLEALGQEINSWSTVDSFARTLSGPAWRDGLIDTATVRDWARYSDRWWRRAALVNTVALNMRSKGGQGDVPNTLSICEMLVEDHDDMVVKALSWALRELVVHEAGAVHGFLDRYEAQLAARVKREVGNKLRTGLKNP
jgi:3-methyladenine DNA glycosylase AlkD